MKLKQFSHKSIKRAKLQTFKNLAKLVYKMEVLTQNERSKITDELMNCQRPLFLFHDDPDGLASFLLFYRWKKEGRGFPIKAVPRITIAYLQKIEDYDADKVFILDIANVDQEFLDLVKVPVVWIDHHQLLERDGFLNGQHRRPDYREYC